MEDSLDGRLLRLNQSLRTRNKRAQGRPQGPLYDWVRRVAADGLEHEEELEEDQHALRAEVAVKDGMLVVKEHLKELKAVSVAEAKEDILRILVLDIYKLASGSFPTCAAEYLSRTLLLTSRRSLKPLVYIALASTGYTAPAELENQFYDIIFQDIDACNTHTLRWVANTTASIPSHVVERMTSSLQNLLFRSVASVSLLEKAASGLLNLTRRHGGSISLSSEMNRCDVCVEWVGQFTHCNSPSHLLLLIFLSTSVVLLLPICFLIFLRVCLSNIVYLPHPFNGDAII